MRWIILNHMVIRQHMHEGHSTNAALFSNTKIYICKYISLSSFQSIKIVFVHVILKV